MEKQYYLKDHFKLLKSALKFIGVFVLCLVFTSSIAVANRINTNIAASDLLTKSIVDTTLKTTTGRGVNVSDESIIVPDESTFNRDIDKSRTVHVGIEPTGIAVSQNGKKVYVANTGSSSVSVIDTTTNDVVATVNDECIAWKAAISPDGKELYVGGSGQISLIDTETDTFIAYLDIYQDIPSILFPEKNIVYKGSDSNVSDCNVSVINATTYAVVATVNVGHGVKGMAISPDRKKLYIIDKEISAVSIIDTETNTVTATFNVSYGPIGVAVSPDGKTLYVTNSESNTVSIIDKTKNVTATVNVGKKPSGVALSPDGKTLYVTNSESNTVSIITIKDFAGEISDLNLIQNVEKAEISSLQQSNADPVKVLKIMQ